MKLALLLGFCSALAAGLLASIVGCRKRPTLADWFLVSGLVAFGVESLLGGWSLITPSPDHIVYWQHWRLILLSLLPGVWLVFSLSYARGNYQQFLAKWKFTLIAAFAISRARKKAPGMSRMTAMRAKAA